MRVLLVEDEPNSARALVVLLRSASAVVDTADGGPEALGLVRHYDYDIIVLDLVNSDSEGLDVVRRIRAAQINVPIIMLSGTLRSELRIKAFSVADSKSCVRCHQGKPRNIEYKVKGAGEIVFSHVNHLGKLGGDCKACHNGKVVTGKNGPVTMAQMEKGQLCGACHNNGKKAFTVVGNCGNCHKGMKPHDIVFKPQGITPATFSHDIHTAAFNCRECHTKVFAFKAGAKHFTMAEMEKGKSCGTCHNGKEAFSVAGDCNKCHKGFKPGVIVFKTETGDAKFSHEFHLEAYKCADCHTKIFAFKTGGKHYTMGDMEHGKSCGACHNGKDAFSSAGDCDKCHKM